MELDSEGDFVVLDQDERCLEASPGFRERFGVHERSLREWVSSARRLREQIAARKNDVSRVVLRDREGIKSPFELAVFHRDTHSILEFLPQRSGRRLSAERRYRGLTLALARLADVDTPESVALELEAAVRSIGQWSYVTVELGHESTGSSLNDEIRGFITQHPLGDSVAVGAANLTPQTLKADVELRLELHNACPARLRDIFRAIGAVTFILAPLKVHGQTMGHIVAWNEEARDVSLTERGAVRLLAQSASRILTSMSRLAETQLRADSERQLRILHKKLSESHSPLSTLDEVAPEILKHLNATGWELIFGDDVHSTGRLPARDDLEELKQWLANHDSEVVSFGPTNFGDGKSGTFGFAIELSEFAGDRLLVFFDTSLSSISHVHIEILLRIRDALVDRYAPLASELQHSNRELRRADETKNQFLATISHELRTPLNAIIGWVQLLKEAKLSNGQFTLEESDFDLVDLAERVCLSFKPKAKLKGVSLELLAEQRPLSILADKERLEQVFKNLLNNAIRHTPEGGRIELHVDRKNGALQVSVTDTGSGINAEELPHVFERFRQASEGPDRLHGGLGLGLEIARDLVNLHGAKFMQRAMVSAVALVLRCPSRHGPIALIQTTSHPRDRCSPHEFSSSTTMRILEIL